MKLYRYWAKVAGEIEHKKPYVRNPRTGERLAPGARQAVTFYGGSNHSVEDAAARAREKIAALQRKVNGETDVFAYERDIREEIIQELDPKNIVSRNRYGALVLNSETTMFLDIDLPRPGLFARLLGRADPERAKQKLLAAFEKKAASYRGLSFHVYETYNGFRAIVTGRDFQADSADTKRMFRDFQVDPTYAYFCLRQQCFRARLTPKAFRMKCKTHRVVYPRNEEEEARHREWVAVYEEACKRFGVCRFVRTLGTGSRTAVIDFHDRVTKAHEAATLA